MSLVSGALLITLIIFSLSVFYFVNRVESAAWRGRQSEAAQNAAATVAGFIQRVQDALVVISIVPPDRAGLESDGLIALLQENKAILEIIHMDAAGNVIASAARDKRVLANLITIPQSQWYLQAKQGRTYIGDVQLSANDMPYLIMAIPGANKTVVAARIQMDILWTVVNNIQFGESGEVIVITQSGNIIAHTNPEFVLTRQTLYGRPEFSAILNAPNNIWSGAYKDFHNEKVVGATTRIPETDWIVLTELPQSEAFAYSRTAVFVLGTEAFLLLFAVSLIVARFIQPLIAEPMEQLIIGADRIGQGDLNFRINMISKNEIGQVASAFNSMAADLEKHQDNLQAAIAYDYEVKRANELARSNAMNLALSKVATLLESSSNSELILDTLGAELKELGLDCGVVTIDPEGEAATIKYLSFNPAIIRTVEKLAGVSAKNYIIPKRYWPDDRALKERIPVWYSNPDNMLLGMFPQIPEKIAKMALQLLGFKPEMQLCMLPLISREQVLGTLIIWGVHLYSSDDIILGVFASQVAGILQNAIAHENETKRANELAHTNIMLLALSKVAAQLETTSDSVMIFETIGNELKKMGLESMVGTLDDAKQNLQIRYISASPDTVSWAEKMTGYHLSDLTIPRLLWPSSKVVDERLYYWNSVKSTLNIFPILTETVQKTALKMAGINVNDPVCYLPIATEHEVIGMLCVWGSELKQSDLPALSILANQVATAIGNSQLYEAEARRGREKEVLLKEIHHRVKNNLQIISSLLNLQSDQIQDSGTLRVLRDSQARVRSMALIHEKLYQSKSLAKINFGEYVQSLSRDLFRSYQRSLGDIKLNVQVDEVSLDLDYAVPCGLILNELMTNALKYAFPNGRNGSILVELRAGPDQTLSLMVADDGVGLPLGLDILKNKSLGLQLINSLVKQVDGNLQVEKSMGTSFQISFKA